VLACSSSVIAHPCATWTHFSQYIPRTATFDILDVVADVYRDIFVLVNHFLRIWGERTARPSSSSGRRRIFDREKGISPISIRLSNCDKRCLSIFWLKDESLEESANLPAPDVIAADIMEDLEAALEQFREIVNDLGADIVTRKEQ